MTPPWRRVLRAEEVPRRPGACGPRQHRLVGVQQGGVVGVGDRGQHLALLRRRLGQHRERGAGVGGDHDCVHGGDRAVAVGHFDAGAGVPDRGDLGADPDVVEAGRDPGDVLAGAADDRAPGGRAEDAEHPVVVEELEEVAGGVVQGDIGVARPHRGDEGLHEVPLEVRREPAGPQEVPQRRVDPPESFGRVSEEGPRAAVEARDLDDQPQVRRVRQVGPAREQSAQAERAGVLEAGRVVAHRQRHLGLLGRDTELVEEAEKRRVGVLVVDDEAGVDGQGALTLRHQMGVGVAAEAVVGLEERDARRFRGDVGCRQSGDTGADDGHPWSGGHAGYVCSNAKSVTGGSVGSSDPPAGSTVMPAPSAVAGSPSSRICCSPPWAISPAGTMPTPSWSSQSS